MLDTLEKFLTNSLVVKVNCTADIIILRTLLTKMGLSKVRQFNHVIKGGADIDWMLSNYPWDELCIEYQLGKGLTISGKTENLQYGNEVMELDDFRNELTINLLREKKFVPIFDEAEVAADNGEFIIKKVWTFDTVSRTTYVCHIGTTGRIQCSEDIEEAKVFKTKKALKNALDKMYEAGEFECYTTEFSLLEK